MPIKIVPKDKKKKKDPKGGGPLMTPGQKKMLDKQTGRGKPMEAKSGGKLEKNLQKAVKSEGFKKLMKDPSVLKKKPVMKKADGGSLKAVPEGKKGKGLSKLPTEVRNKMGFMKKGGKLTSNKSKIKKVTTGLKKAVKAHTGQAKMLSSIKLKKGGKVVKMRGGGAATRGMNFNRGY